VDDFADNVELLAGELEDRGYEVMKAQNGPEALDVATASRPDVILLDIMMVGMDGIEVCRRLKADSALRSIPVIMVSALEEEVDLIRGLGRDRCEIETGVLNRPHLARQITKDATTSTPCFG